MACPAPNPPFLEDLEEGAFAGALAHPQTNTVNPIKRPAHADRHKHDEPLIAIHLLSEDIRMYRGKLSYISRWQSAQPRVFPGTWRQTTCHLDENKPL